MPEKEPSGQGRQHLLQELFGVDGVPSDVAGRLLRASDVALLFQVSERTVSDWATKGLVPSVRTPGGHRRYPADAIAKLLSSAPAEEAANALPGADMRSDPAAG